MISGEHTAVFDGRLMEFLYIHRFAKNPVGFVLRVFYIQTNDHSGEKGTYINAGSLPFRLPGVSLLFSTAIALRMAAHS